MVSASSLLLLLEVQLVFSQPTIEGQCNDVCRGYHMVSDQMSRVRDFIQGTQHCKCNNKVEPMSETKGMMINSPSMGCSYLLMLETKTWDDARQDCAKRGYNLAWIDSMQEQNYVVNFIKANPDISNISLQHFGVWLGGTEFGHQGCWVWIKSKIAKIYRFTHWAEGEPNNYEGNVEDCMQMEATLNYMWNDLPCSRRLPYLCKRFTGIKVTSDVTSQMIRETPVCHRK